jgi:hypothetical protein
MLIDAFNIFDNNVAITATAVSTNIYDTLSVGDIGIGTPPYLVVNIGTAFAGSSTLTITLQTDDNSSFSSPVAVYVSRAITVAEMTAGKQLLNLPIPSGCERYLRVAYTVSSTSFSAGTVTSFLALEQAEARRHYPTNFNINYI